VRKGVLPPSVRRAWGEVVAQDFVEWLEARLRAAGLDPAVRISAFIARQKVNVLMLEQVSNLLLAGEPELRQDANGCWIWRVPVDLTLPSLGRVGRVGEIEVDAQYGEVRYDEGLLSRITEQARRLARQAHQEP